jgi:hypothetical protein
MLTLAVGIFELVSSAFPWSRSYIVIMIGIAYGAFFLIGFVNTVYKVKVSRDQVIAELKQALEEKSLLEKAQEESKSLSRIVPQTFIYEKIKKRVEIENEEGDAFVEVTYSVKSSDRPPREIKHELRYDGPTYKERKDIHVSVEGGDVSPTLVSHYNKVQGTGEQWSTRISIPLAGRTPPFTYSYKTLYQKVFPNLRSDKAVENTGQVIRHVTEGLIIEVVSQKHPFERDKKYEVLDYFGRKDQEEERNLESSGQTPQFSADNTRIEWRIKWPKICYQYIVYFRIPPT